MKIISRTLIILVFFGVSFYGCKSEKKTTATTTPTVVKKEIRKETTAPETSFECSDKMTYNTIVKPIIDAACIKCHKGPKPAHGIDLTTYANVKEATSHNLLCTITKGNNCPKMPPSYGGTKISKDEISTIDCWIKNGMIN